MKRIAFVRIPKNASRSIKRTNLFICKSHERLSVMINNYKFDYSFCVCRNPYSRVLSAYKNGKAFYEKKQYPYFQQFKKYKSFEQFCLDRKNPFFFGLVTRMGHDNKPKVSNKHIHFFSQKYWIDGKINRVLRFENLNEEWIKLLQDLKIPFYELNRINKSDHESWKTYYTEEIAKSIYSIYQEDFKAFNYQKDSWRI